jgi:membrane-associated phospholipid phosphatase
VTPGRLALVLAAAFGLVAGLLAAGLFDPIDSYAVHHLMPGLGTDRDKPSLVDSLVPFLHQGHPSGITRVADVITLPASAVPSLLLLGGGCLLLWRRGARSEALLWASAWVVGDAIELLCKSVVQRPALYVHTPGQRYPNHVFPFDGSYPSGHTLRAFLVAAVATRLWHRGWPFFLVWAAAIVVALEVAGQHAPTDLLGGLLLAAFLIACVRTLEPLLDERLARRPARRRAP